MNYPIGWWPALVISHLLVFFNSLESLGPHVLAPVAQPSTSLWKERERGRECLNF